MADAPAWTFHLVFSTITLQAHMTVATREGRHRQVTPGGGSTLTTYAHQAIRHGPSGVVSALTTSLCSWVNRHRERWPGKAGDRVIVMGIG